MTSAGVAAFASLLLPPDGGAYVEVGSWRRLPDLPDADVVVLATPTVHRPTTATAARAALEREARLRRLRRRPPKGWEVTGIHRIRPAPPRRDLLGRVVKDAVASGVVVELRRPAAPASRIDQVLAEVHAHRCPGTSWHVGPGGALLGFVRSPSGDAVVRATADPGRTGAGTVAHGAAGLRAVADRDVGTPAPRLLEAGAGDGIGWSLEERLPGRPAAVAPPHIAAVSRLLAQLRGADAPTATATDVAVIGEHLPDVASDLDRASAAVATWSGGSVLRHGDLWSGNLLLDGGRITGLVDWDQWHPAAVPGTDVLQLATTDDRHRRRQSLGACWLTRPWNDDGVRSHLRHVGVVAAESVEAAAVAWWATEVAGSLARHAELADDGRWVDQNVVAVLRALSR